jgi:folylpolyglutamate synthase/dihydropteroate synthase
MMGLLSFRNHQCDYVVLECGIGARIDGTNIVQYPDVVCSVITSIGLDHQELLGNTLE